MRSPRIEHEVVLKLRDAPASSDPAAVLEAVEWLALGFEFVDCPYPGWKFQPADFVASFGLARSRYAQASLSAPERSRGRSR